LQCSFLKTAARSYLRPRAGAGGVGGANGGEVNATAGQRVYETIRKLIVDGGLPPGHWLKEEELTGICGASRTPVREAIRRLAAEGLVVKAPRLGAQVATIGRAELEELYELRALLERHAATRAATRLTADQIERLKELAAIMEKAAISGPDAVRARYTPANAEFHRIILQAADSPRLSAMAALVMEQPLTLRTLASYSPDDRQRSLRHHRELIAAFEAKNPAWAAASMEAHVRAALQALVGGGPEPDA
jgi:DNA-binding GntR family transcriptional regulator